MKRTLALKREQLTQLTTDELAVFRGAGGETGPQPTPPVYAPVTVDYKRCIGTTMDSVVVCSDRCGMTFGASCHC